MPDLLLFDIDATLLLTSGGGMAAMEETGRELFHPGFSVQGIDFAGRLDPLLYREMMAANKVQHREGAESEFRVLYAAKLKARLAANPARALPGTHELVGALRARDARSRPMLGLLTGNYAETASLKLSSCGFDAKWFEVCAWGDDSPHDPPAREHLPPVAMSRFRERVGREVDPARVTIIGDTPHDVRCAKVNGCRVLGVGTGKFSVERLLEAGADHAVSTLEDTRAIMSWLAQA
jgi:phosphoglycolate phosphatase-like HAD superfamily hydrolase